MRIGIEAQRIFRAKKHGMDIFALQLIKNLQAVDLENEYFIFVKSGPDRDCLEETENFKIVELRGFTYLDWEQIALPIAVKKMKIEVLHCTSNTAPLFVNVPTVLTIHDVIYLTSKDAHKGTWYQTLGHYYRKWVVPAVAKKAKKIVTVSNFELQSMREHIHNPNISYIYNGVADCFFKYTYGDRPYGLPEKYLFFLGNLAHKKNMKNLLKAYAWYVDQVSEPIPLVVAETSRRELHQLFDELNVWSIQPFVKLVGYVPQPFLPALYYHATLFIYPSLFESFGIPILEAMACGTPVITSSYTAMPEVAGDCALKVETKDFIKLGGAIKYLLEDDQLREKLRTEGISRSQNFRWTNAAKSYLDLYGPSTVRAKLSA